MVEENAMIAGIIEQLVFKYTLGTNNGLYTLQTVKFYFKIAVSTLQSCQLFLFMWENSYERCYLTLEILLYINRIPAKQAFKRVKMAFEYISVVSA